jgi:hypothetical protein
LALVGTYDFELLGDIEATGCAEKGVRVTFVTATTGYDTAGLGLTAQSRAAAVFEALSKVRGSDLVFVTRSVSQGDLNHKICTTVYGKAIRLKKGPTVIQDGYRVAGQAGAVQNEAKPADPAQRSAPAPKEGED